MKISLIFLMGLILLLNLALISSKDSKNIEKDSPKTTKHKEKQKEAQIEELTDEEKEEEVEWENNTEKDNNDNENLDMEDEVLKQESIDKLMSQTTEEKEEQMRNELEQEQEELADDNDSNIFLEKWEEYMKDFDPQDILNFKIKSKQAETLVENLKEKFVPAYFRGAYLVYSDDEDDSIDFLIYDPKGEMIWHNFKEKQGMFFFNATIPGKYQFMLSNKRFSNEKQVTFAFHDGKIIPEDAYKRKPNPLIDSVSDFMIKIKDLMILSKVISKKQDTHYATIIETHKKIFAFTLFETLAIILSSVFTIYSIKKLLNDKIVV